MAWQLSYEKRAFFDPGKPGISVPVNLLIGNDSVDVETKLDTGSTYCVFERVWGESLGFDIESGHRVRIATATGSFIAYGHSVTLSVVGYDLDSVVYFAEDRAIKRNVLGRHGFLDRVQFGLIDYIGQLYLSRYGDHL